MVKRKLSASLILLFAVLYLFCKIPIDPNTNPDNARISHENLSRLPDTVPVGTAFICTVAVSLPNLIDDATILVQQGNEITPVISGKPAQDTIVFTQNFLQPSDYVISVIISKGVQKDTLVKEIHVFSTTPVVKFGTSHITAHIGDTVSFPFTITDPDSNLLSYTLNFEGKVVNTNVLASERYKKNGSLAPYSISDLKTNNIYSIVAIDESQQFSIAETCTLEVTDTIQPEAHILKPFNDSAFTIKTLPCTLFYALSDNWGFDSVKVSGFHQSVPLHDTLTLIKTSLDSGTTIDSIELWDKGGNHKVLSYMTTYNGVKLYPPKLKQIYIPPVFEHARFDTIYLDSLITITDTSATYGKNSLVWSISADSTDSLLKPRYDTLKRTFYVQVPDRELGHNRLAIYTFKAADPKGLSTDILRLYFTVLEKNDPPLIAIRDQSKTFNVAFDTLTLAKCGTDPDLSDRIQWTIQRGKYFKPDSIWNSRFLVKTSALIPNAVFTGRVAIIPDTTELKKVPLTSSVTDSLLFIATDGELTTKEFVKFSWNRIVKNQALTDSIKL